MSSFLKIFRVKILETIFLDYEMIFFINSLANGGAERVVASLAQSGNARVLTIWPDNFQSSEYHFTHTSLLKRKSFLLFDIFLACFKLFFYLKKNNILEVNSHLFWANYINVIVSFFLKHKAVLTHCVSINSKFSNRRLLYFLHYYLSHILVNKAYRNTFKSYGILKEYQELFNLRNGVVIHNPINLELLCNKSNEPISFEFNDNVEYILVVGRFHRTKNQKSIIRYLPNISRKYEIIFLGDGEMFDSCKKLAVELNVSDRCHFLGAISNPFPFYSKVNVCLSFSLSEGFPNVLIESLALGCFPIFYDCDFGPREVLSSSLEVDVCPENFIVYELGILLVELSSTSINLALDYYNLNKFSPLSREARDDYISNLEVDKILLKYKEVF